MNAEALSKLPFSDLPLKKCPEHPKASTEVPTKVSTQAVQVHLSCFHPFCSSTKEVRRAPDYSSNLCPPKIIFNMIYMTFLGGVLGPFIQEKEQEAGPKHP